MKKLLAVILSVALLACVFAVPVRAVDGNEKSNYLFMDKYYTLYGGLILDYNENEEMTDADKEQYYKELFYHYDESGEVDWAFVFCRTNWENPTEGYFHIGNRLIFSAEAFVPFSLAYGVYDVADDRFYDITKVCKNEKYEGIAELFEQVCDNGFVEYNTSLVIGDMNYDGFITVSDANYLQKCLAGLEDYPVTPELQMFIDQKVAGDPNGGHITFDINDFYDVNTDGTVSIGDATKLQKISAEFDD